MVQRSSRRWRAHNVSSSSKGRASGEMERTEMDLELRARLVVLGWPLGVVLND